MKNTLIFFLSVLLTGSVWADEVTRNVQQQLKDQGFYYGEVDGQGGEETNAAIRRYQIRHGLRVTGQLNDETMRTLGMSSDSVARPAPGYQKNGGTYNPQPDDRYYRQPPRQYYGRPLPQRPGLEDYNEAQPAPYGAPEVATSFPRLFAGTFYERAPAQLQENVLLAVQGELLKKGLYRGVVDGQPGPGTSDALFRFQEYEGLPPTGRLDNETLNALRALPGQRNGPPEEGFRRSPGGERIYRGIPVQ